MRKGYILLGVCFLGLSYDYVIHNRLIEKGNKCYDRLPSNMLIRERVKKG